MSLLEEMMEPCLIMNKAKVPDGQGGFTTEWVEGAEILVAIVNDQSMQARRAEKEGVTSTFTLTTTRANALEFHDVIKRESDGKIFRVTSNTEDKKSPVASMSTLDMAQCSAENWELTT